MTTMNIMSIMRLHYQQITDSEDKGTNHMAVSHMQTKALVHATQQPNLSSPNVAMKVVLYHSKSS